MKPIQSQFQFLTGFCASPKLYYLFQNIYIYYCKHNIPHLGPKHINHQKIIPIWKLELYGMVS